MRFIDKLFMIKFSFAFLLLWGCATFMGDGRPTEPAPGFRQEVSSGSSRPLPVEIAQDIASISENGALFLQMETFPEEKQVMDQAEKEEQLPPAEQKTSAEEVVGDTAPEMVPTGAVIPPGPLQAAQEAENSKGPLQFDLVKARRISSTDGGKTIRYRVKKGDTLMEIAFEKFGNAYRWREIYQLNRSKIPHYKRLQIGTVLVINNVQFVYVRKNGRPYLIRKHDTLGAISQQLYGSTQYWRNLWKNNPQLIHDPNKIYAGFTLYYQPQQTDMRQPARQPVQQSAPTGQ